MNRAFVFAFSLSLGLHLGLIMMDLPYGGWFKPRQRARPALEVIYDYEIAKEELRRVTERLASVKQGAPSAPAPSAGVGGMQIRIPQRPLFTPEHEMPELTPDRSPIVDLSDLVEASQGNPVLLSYYSVIREEIQLAANRKIWTTGERQGGVVYVSFVVLSTGMVTSLVVLDDRSAQSRRLRDVSVSIVQSAAPFPAFPPSVQERKKTIIVPLDFMLGI